MVKRSVVESDLSKRPNAATVTFGLFDDWYEIDLTAKERRELQAELKKYVEAARKATPPKPRAVPEMTPEEREAIRAWGRDNGFNAQGMGRISKELQAAYDEVHGIVTERRKAPPKPRRSPGPEVPEMTPEERETIRAWGRENGFKAQGKGRISKELQAAYDGAHGIVRKR
ncbi:Lsr2 family protein [Kribbella sp. NBC_01245]|uniref:Lsr2 dimerization domain-containing protein n=1 Tax=Kribbella sp. NBC_01245 TaxID=2903578 RepID=UPI002E2E7EF3|nr:histone-like nucleoid-structuring protein Lsr2 [Kribbella sp. NBC_01245]